MYIYLPMVILMLYGWLCSKYKISIYILDFIDKNRRLELQMAYQISGGKLFYQYDTYIEYID